MLENVMFDLSKKEIEKGVGLSNVTVDKTLKTLEKNKMITVTRKIGKFKMYRINTESPIVRKLSEIEYPLREEAVGVEKVKPGRLLSFSV